MVNVICKFFSFSLDNSKARGNHVFAAFLRIVFQTQSYVTLRVKHFQPTQLVRISDLLNEQGTRYKYIFQLKIEPDKWKVIQNNVSASLPNFSAIGLNANA